MGLILLAALSMFWSVVLTLSGFFLLLYGMALLVWEFPKKVRAAFSISMTPR